MGVIVDTVMDEMEWLSKTTELLHDYPALFVHVTCPPEVLAQREKARGDREIGLAVSQLKVLHPLCETYDLTIDTHAQTTEECVDKIISALETGNYQALAKLKALS